MTPGALGRAAAGLQTCREVEPRRDRTRKLGPRAVRDQDLLMLRERKQARIACETLPSTKTRSAFDLAAQ